MSWPTCEHGYYTTPSHRCPWCHGDDVTPYKHRAKGTKGNGWLLYAEGFRSLVCEGCGGPRCAGWGAWAGPDEPTPERVYEQLSTAMYCYSCVCDGKSMKRTSKKGERVTSDEKRRLDAGACPDCGKRFVQLGVCPRLTCGSRFDGDVRATNAHPDEPPKKYVEVPLREKK